jgi:hypothetical protein
MEVHQDDARADPSSASQSFPIVEPNTDSIEIRSTATKTDGLRQAFCLVRQNRTRCSKGLQDASQSRHRGHIRVCQSGDNLLAKGMDVPRSGVEDDKED